MNWNEIGPWLLGLASLIGTVYHVLWQRAQLQREPTRKEQEEIDLRRQKEEAADRLAIRTYEWYDGSFASAIRQVEWTRKELEQEREDRQAAVKRERELRLAAEKECEIRIEALKAEIKRMKSGLP